MRDVVEGIVGAGVMAAGLAGLGVALAVMTTHTDPHGALVSVAGLGVFVLSTFFLLLSVR
jgi:hypothetical protein